MPKNVKEDGLENEKLELSQEYGDACALQTHFVEGYRHKNVDKWSLFV